MDLTLHLLLERNFQAKTITDKPEGALDQTLFIYDLLFYD